MAGPTYPDAYMNGLPIHAGNLISFPFEDATRQGMPDTLAIRYAEPPRHIASLADSMFGLHISR